MIMRLIIFRKSSIERRVKLLVKYDFDHVTDRCDTNSLKWNTFRNELPMWVADMDFLTAPEILSELQKRLSHGIFGYSVLPDEWYHAYIEWWQSRHNLKFERQQMLFSPGVLPTICTCIRELTNIGDNVLLLSPVYNCFYDCISSNGRTVLECPLIYDGNKYRIDDKLLKQQLSDSKTKMIILSNPHNPTGNIWSKDDLAVIGRLARENDVIVVSDEIHCDITDPDINYVPYLAAASENSNRSVTCISPTKAFNLAGLHTSAVVIADKTIRWRIKNGLHSQRIDGANAFAVQAAVSAFQNGGAWLDSLRHYLFENKQLVRTRLEAELPELKLIHSQATYLLWIDGTRVVTDDGCSLAQSIRRRTGLFLSDGAQFGNGGKGFLRMNIACPYSVVQDGLERLVTSVKAMR